MGVVTTHVAFEWDPAKERANLAKHGLNFTDARNVLAAPLRDAFNSEEYDYAHSQDEERWNTYGPHPDHPETLLRVTWAGRPRATRIISARKADRREAQAHARRLAGG